MAKRIIPGSRDFIAEARQADLAKADAERAAARAMLAALKKIEQAQEWGDEIMVIETARAAIAQAEAAGIKP